MNWYHWSFSFKWSESSWFPDYINYKNIYITNDPYIETSTYIRLITKTKGGKKILPSLLSSTAKSVFLISSSMSSSASIRVESTRCSMLLVPSRFCIGKKIVHCIMKLLCSQANLISMPWWPSLKATEYETWLEWTRFVQCTRGWKMKLSLCSRNSFEWHLLLRSKNGHSTQVVIHKGFYKKNWSLTALK